MVLAPWVFIDGLVLSVRNIRRAEWIIALGLLVTFVVGQSLTRLNGLSVLTWRLVVFDSTSRWTLVGMVRHCHQVNAKQRLLGSGAELDFQRAFVPRTLFAHFRWGFNRNVHLHFSWGNSVSLSWTFLIVDRCAFSRAVPRSFGIYQGLEAYL